MPYTLAEFKAAALHAAGRGTVDTGNSTLIIVNQAVAECCGDYPWSWRHKSATLNFVGSQSYVTLPADFSSLVYLDGGVSQRLQLRPTSLDQIFKARQAVVTVTSVLDYLYAIGSDPQASLTTDATYRIELYPTPSASLSGAMQIQYLRDIPDLANDTDHVDAPAYMQSIILMMVRGFAELMELNAPGPNWQVAHQQLASAQQRDAMMQPVVGKLRGAVQQVEARRIDPRRYYGQPTVTI